MIFEHESRGCRSKKVSHINKTIIKVQSSYTNNKLFFFLIKPLSMFIKTVAKIFDECYYQSLRKISLPWNQIELIFWIYRHSHEGRIPIYNKSCEYYRLSVRPYYSRTYSRNMNGLKLYTNEWDKSIFSSLFII